MASHEKVQLPADHAARSKVIDQIKHEMDQIAAVSTGPSRMVDQHGKVDVHLKSGKAIGTEER